MLTPRRHQLVCALTHQQGSDVGLCCQSISLRTLLFKLWSIAPAESKHCGNVNVMAGTLEAIMDCGATSAHGSCTPKTTERRRPSP